MSYVVWQGLVMEIHPAATHPQRLSQIARNMHAPQCLTFEFLLVLNRRLIDVWGGGGNLSASPPCPQRAPGQQETILCLARLGSHLQAVCKSLTGEGGSSLHILD